jgi:TetR/AcrR family transcriptional regulator, acrAB operon repressor
MARRTAEEAARTRDAVVDAALVVFSERGYTAAQLEEIAGRAGVTRGALYHHFHDKADLFLAVLRERWHSVMAPVLSELASEAEAASRLRSFVASFLTAMDSDPRARALMKMSLSGDVKLPEFAPHIQEKSDAFESWRHEIAGVLKEAGIGADANGRAQALLMGLIGYSVWSSMRSAQTKAREAERRTLVDSLMRGALDRM